MLIVFIKRNKIRNRIYVCTLFKLISLLVSVRNSLNLFKVCAIQFLRTFEFIGSYIYKAKNKKINEHKREHIFSPRKKVPVMLM